ncbi:GntR family transcriptional regulator [Ancylobacter sp. SL191]|uniref:GntR family transcriptional regulator n=1 Tax=Ancylobacter sp. SL191 TaxID=2995166 RepID=UPI00226D4627|nr:GntR family transcriptional regulator [Ancylobacter sp. SL191]WAC29313.1 GntR family transcriptional regulator [Ancylobacter sp. SL191]
MATSAGAVPRYAEIAATLRAEIDAGHPAPGARLSTEHELCARFGASRFTIRQALAGLREDGLIAARAGAGTVVVASRRREAFVHTLASVEELLHYPAETFRRTLRIDPVTASPELAHLLTCPVGQSWVRLKAVRQTRVAQAPIAYFDIYVRPEHAAVLDLPNPDGAPVIRQIEQALGLRAAHAQIEIFVGRITDDLAEPLMAQPGDPALIIVRRYRGPDGGVYLVTYSVHPENRFTLNIEFERR